MSGVRLEAPASAPRRAALWLAASGLLLGGAGLLPAVGKAMPWLLGGCLLAATAARREQPRLALFLILLLGSAARWPLLEQWPETSDDIYRYVWEGRLWWAGETPYRFPPDSPRFASLRDAVVHPRINHPEIPTIYPPAAQALFAAAAPLPAPLGWKALLAIGELLAALALGRQAARRGASLSPTALYFLNPLLLVESAEGGHVDGAGAAMFLGALIWARSPARGRWAVCCATLAALVKFTPIVALPLFARWRRDLGPMLVAVVGGAALLLGTAWTPAGWLASPTLTGGPESARAEFAWEPRSGGVVAVQPFGEGWASADGQRVLLPREASTALILTGPDTPAPDFLLPADARRLLGSYVFGLVAPGPGSEDLPTGVWHFDAQDGMRGPDGSAAFAALADGFALRDARGRPIGRARLSDDRQWIEVTPWQRAEPQAVAVGLAVANAPWLGLTQFRDRWSGLAVALPALEWIAGSRRGALALAAAIVGLLLAGCWWRRVELAPGCFVICLSGILCLPVVYPWYLTWTLAPAVLLRRPALWAGLLGLAPLAHLL